MKPLCPTCGRPGGVLLFQTVAPCDACDRRAKEARWIEDALADGLTARIFAEHALVLGERRFASRDVERLPGRVRLGVPIRVPGTARTFDLVSARGELLVEGHYGHAGIFVEAGDVTTIEVRL